MSEQLSAKDQAQLKAYMDKTAERARYFLGYPSARDFNYETLYPLFGTALNNIGDPFIESSSYDLHSHAFELEVLRFFADLFHAPEGNWWGYIGAGGSEGNLYALYLARELYPGGIVFYSAATHYSIQKNISLLGMRSIVTRTESSGEMDYHDLENLISLHREHPVIVLANIGTTMTEARDDIGKVQAIFDRLAVRNHYIHCDAALAGTYAAALELEPKFDFNAGADSIAISGHKFIGSPVPCGLVLVKKNYKDRIGKVVPYIGTMDTTISGSRSGHSPVFLWYAIKKLGIDGIRRRAIASMELAEYALKALQLAGKEAWRNPDAITVVFTAPPEVLRKKWQIATDKGWSHIICMPGVTRGQIDDFIGEWMAFPEVAFR